MGERGRRSQIIKAATILFREKGYHATTIRDIADRSGVLSGSLYAHIKTKEDLLFEITDEVADQFLNSLQAISSSLDSPMLKFRNALRNHIRVVSNHLDAAAVFSHEWRALSEDRRQVIQQKRDSYEQLWARILEEGVQTGEFHAGHLRFSRVLTLSVANWLYQWYSPTGVMTPEEVSDCLADVILRGLATKEVE